MAYRLIDMHLKNGVKFSYKLTSDIFKKYLEELESCDIKYLHFNHYNDERGIFRITVRFEFENEDDDKKAISIAEDLEKNDIIQSKRIRSDSSVKKSVKIAHRFASMCVYELIANHDDFLNIHKKPLDVKSVFRFTLYFIKQLLEKIGYKLFITWDSLGPYDYSKKLKEEADKMVDACYKFVPSEEDVFSDADFLERFIHLYLNCALLQFPILDNMRIKRSFEREIWNSMMLSHTLKDITQTYNKKTKE